jgi:hypothetical protein
MIISSLGIQLEDQVAAVGERREADSGDNVSVTRIKTDLFD